MALNRGEALHKTLDNLIILSESRVLTRRLRMQGVFTVLAHAMMATNAYAFNYSGSNDERC
ncbi:MAG TPA: hypothetical protein VNM22_13250 [Candidatus Limnocylindrales bacterium]|nr:hypothetical protein [Candidatus Limnocylindrales bacterium]